MDLIVVRSAQASVCEEASEFEVMDHNANTETQEIEIGAFDAEAWNGVVIRSRNYSFAIRIATFFNGKWFDYGDGVNDAVSLVGPCEPDGSYARVGWDLAPGHRILFEWSGDVDRKRVIGRIDHKGAEVPINLFIQVYTPWRDDVLFSPSESGGDGVCGHFRFFLRLGRNADRFGRYKSLSSLKERIGLKRDLPKSDGHEAMAFQLRPFHPGDRLTFSAIVRDAQEKGLHSSWRGLDSMGVNRVIEWAKNRHAGGAPSGRGILTHAPESVCRNLFWNVVYAKNLKRTIPGVSRRYSDKWGGWCAGGWDSFFNALLAAAQDEETAYRCVDGILEAQDKSGMTPSAVSADGITTNRSQPPIGSYVAYRLFQRFGNKDFLARVYPSLKKWHSWWSLQRKSGAQTKSRSRNGFPDLGSEITTGVPAGCSRDLDQMKSAVGSSAAGKKSNGAISDSVDFASIYALDAEILANIAAELRIEDEAVTYRIEHAELTEHTNERLWDARRRAYMSRNADGTYAPNLTPAIFFPMLAGTATPQRAKAMLDHLYDCDAFAGKYIIPAIERKAPEFTDQHLGRGTICGPINYLVYHGLRRCGFLKEATDLAKRSLELFMPDWRENHACHESYLASGCGSGESHHSWGALLPLIAIEDLIDRNPWEGLCFGREEAVQVEEVRRLRFGDGTMGAVLGPRETRLEIDGEIYLIADGPARFSRCVFLTNRLLFEVQTKRILTISIPRVLRGIANVRYGAKRPVPHDVSDAGLILRIEPGKKALEISW